MSSSEKMSSKWNDSTVARFLEDIRHHPCIYNKQDPHYRNDKVKLGVWKLLGDNQGKSVKAVMDKWKGMKDTYLRKRKTREAPSAAVAIINGTYNESWKHYEAMEHLLGGVQIVNYNSIRNIEFTSMTSKDSDYASQTAELLEVELVENCDSQPPTPVSTGSNCIKRKRPPTPECKESEAITEPDSILPDVLISKQETQETVPDDEEEITGILKIIRANLLQVPKEHRSEAICHLHLSCHEIVKQYKE